MDSKDFENMDFSSCDNFCSLDMLAEVASATLQSDPSLVPKLPQKTKPKKVFSPKTSRRKLNKYVSSYEKFTLEQIKNLSEKNLLELFSEHICDEMKKIYSFRCFLIPDKCSQVYQSFGNETKARFMIKSHLLSHIKELSAAAEVSDNQEEFTAEPLHSRNKRLKETSCKNVKKKNKGKQIHKKAKESFVSYFDTRLEDYLARSTETNIKNAAVSDETMKTEKGAFDYGTSDDFEIFRSSSENVIKSFTKDKNRVKKTTYFPVGPLCSSKFDHTNSSKTVVVKFHGHQSDDHENSSLAKKHVKKKQQSKRKSDSKVKTCDDLLPNSSQISSSDYFERSTPSKCDYQSQSENILPVHHDHTYTSVNGKTLNCDYSVMGEGSKSSKLCKDYFHPKKAHLCIKKESPLVIPTPAFPYVYNPVLPHIASMQEVGSDVDTERCKCSDTLSGSIIECDYNPKHVPHSLPKQPECYMSSTSECTDTVHVVHLLSENSSSYDSSVKDNLSEVVMKTKPVGANTSEDPSEVAECLEREKCEEKELALKCIGALRTKKKDDRGPLTCQICKKSFTAQATLMYHYRSHAGIKPFLCSVCDATFTRQHSLNYHMLIHNNQSRFVCASCGRSFRHPSHFKDHLKRHSGKTSSGDTLYECAECDPR